MTKYIALQIFLVMILLTSCTTQSSKVEVGFLINNSSSDRWKKEAAFFTERISEAGGTVITKSADNDENKQIAQAIELINSGVDILVINCVNGNTAAAIVRAAHNKGIKVIAYDRIIKNCDLDFFITFDGEKVGELLASYIFKLKPSGNFVIFDGDKADENALKFYDGIMKVVQPAIDEKRVNVVYSGFIEDWSGVNARYYFEKVLEFSNTKIDGVIAAYDGFAEGINEVLKARGLVDSIPVTGQDAEIAACHRIMNDQQAMTIYKPGKLMAYQCADVAIKLIKNENIDNIKYVNNGSVDVPSLILEPIAVDKKNMGTTVVADGIFTMDQIMEYIPKGN